MRVPKKGLCIVVGDKEMTLTPALDYSCDYSKTASKIGTFEFLCEGENKIGVAFVHNNGDTFVTYDTSIANFLQNAGYRISYYTCKHAIAM